MQWACQLQQVLEAMQLHRHCRSELDWNHEFPFAEDWCHAFLFVEESHHAFQLVAESHHAFQLVAGRNHAVQSALARTLVCLTLAVHHRHQSRLTEPIQLGHFW